MTMEHRIVKQLRGMAAGISGDRELQKDLLQEMLIHHSRVQTDRPGHTASWYIKSCHFHAYKYLARGRSVDSLKRRHNLVPLAVREEKGDGAGMGLDAVDPADLCSELITRDIVDLMLPQLNAKQQQILFLLLHGFGVREIARELRVSHPSIIKHRKQIARTASALLADNGMGAHGRTRIARQPARYDRENNGSAMGKTVCQREDMPERMMVWVTP
jgi:DNA-directed RNA polymerase specialized sigma24 family protein